MTERTQIPTTHDLRWPHRLATVLICAVFPLIWVGGLVTSSDAGMAVPDWPNTFGWNLFLYPWQTWFFGPWDIFVEHGHRLLGAATGMLTIALVWSLWRSNASRGLKWLGVATLAAVIGQGVLGGMRVVLDARLLAMAHACTGPIYFAMCVALWHGTSKHVASMNVASHSKIFRLALLTTGFAYIQLVLGAVVRHMPVYAPPRTFHTAVMFHFFMAGVLTIHVILLAFACYRAGSFRLNGTFLASLIVVQLSLGLGTWVVNFGYPQWVNAVAATPDFVVRTHSWPQLLITTAHVAVGSLILVTSMLLALKSRPAMQVASSTTSLFAGLLLREALQ